MERMNVVGHGTVTRLLVRAAELAHWTQFDAFPGYRRAYETLYPAYKYLFDGGVLRWVRRNHDQLRGGHLVDAGANFGVISKELVRALSPECALLSIEPEPTCFQSLVGGLSQFDSAHCLPVALGESNRQGALLVHRYHRGDDQLLVPGQPTSGPDTQPVCVRTLDSLVEDMGLCPADVRFVKLDLQGFERHALEGMRNILAAARSLTLCLEFTPLLLKRAGVVPAELFAFLEQVGYGTLSRITQNGQALPVADWQDLVSLGSADILVSQSV